MKITICTPFSKKYCFDEYTQSVEDLLKHPLAGVSYYFVAYDNTNDTLMSEKIKMWLETLNPLVIKSIYLQDNTPPVHAKSFAEYPVIAQRLSEIYNKITYDLIPNDTDYVLNIDDDCTVEPNSLEKAIHVMGEHPQISTVAANVYLRKMDDPNSGSCMVYGFRKMLPTEFNIKLSYISYPTITVPSAPQPQFPEEPHFKQYIMPDRPFGFEIVGNTSMSFWLTKYSMLKEMGFKPFEDGIQGADTVWGYRLWKEGKGFQVVDWSIRAKHWYLYEGVKDYYSYIKH